VSVPSVIRQQELSVPKVFEKLLRAGEGRVLKRLEGIAAQVNALEEDFERLTDDELRDETAAFKQRLAEGESLDDLLPEAFAACARRASGRWASATSTSRSWVAPRCTWATSPR
jgi:preprotein translocase subunit SecA